MSQQMITNRSNYTALLNTKTLSGCEDFISEYSYDDILNRLLEEKRYNEYIDVLALNGMKPDPLPAVISQGPGAMLDNFKAEHIGILHASDNSTADYRHAMSFKLGQMHELKYFDFGDVAEKLQSLENKAATADYSGMSDAQKAMAVFNKWDDAFGDFRKAKCIGYVRYSGTDKSESIRIEQQFEKELVSVFGSAEKAYEAYKTALRETVYKDLNDGGIRDAITAKYLPLNRITLRRLHEMLWDMNCAGVCAGISNVLSWAEDQAGGHLVREELMDKTLDINWIIDAYNEMRAAVNKNAYNDTGDCAETLSEIFGVTIDDNKNALKTPQSSINYSTLITQARQKYASWTKTDYERWLYAQFVAEYDRWVNGNQQQIIINELWQARAERLDTKHAEHALQAENAPHARNEKTGKEEPEPLHIVNNNLVPSSLLKYAV